MRPLNPASRKNVSLEPDLRKAAPGEGRRAQRPRLQRPSIEERYEVGYAKPPVSTRFKPGQSGNPKGRPKGSKNKKSRLNEERFKEIILAEAYRTIKVSDGDRNVSIPMAQAVVRALAVNAAKGQHRAQLLFAELVSSTERANKAVHDDYLETMIEYKVEWERELCRREALGIVAADPLPHPDDIVIDMNSGEVRVYGPMTKEEKRLWDKLRVIFDATNAGIAELQKLLSASEPTERHLIESEIDTQTKLRDRIRSVIGDWPHKRGKPCNS